VAVLALIAFVAKTYCGVEVPEIDKLTELILITLTSLGIFNNPTNAEGY
jgi:uncharacterized membrane protein